MEFLLRGGNHVRVEVARANAIKPGLAGFW
jgi:hypothetical protein